MDITVKDRRPKLPRLRELNVGCLFHLGNKDTLSMLAKLSNDSHVDLATRSLSLPIVRLSGAGAGEISFLAKDAVVTPVTQSNQWQVEEYV